MKKLLISTVVGLATLTAFAQNHASFSFLTVRSLEVTNTIGVTNLSLIGGITTNVPGVIFTNLAGTASQTWAVTNTATNNASWNFFQDSILWADRNSTWYQPNNLSTNGVNALQVEGPSSGKIYVKLVGGSGANTATSFVFVPVVDDSGNESNQAGDAFTFAVTPNTTTIVSLMTNFPSWKYTGCKGLRLKSITAGDTDANSQVNILALEFVGFRP